MKKADGWSMGQEEQKKKALEEKLRRRAYTAAFEAAQQRKEKPWQSWDEAFSERLAKQPFITEEERKPFAPSGAGAQNAFYTGEKQPWPGLGEAWPGQARRAERTPWAALPENPPSGAGTMLLAGQRRSMAQAAPGGEPPAGPEQGAPGANGRTFGSTLDLDVPQVNPQDTPAPMSASFLARAIARADTFDLGAARKRRDTRAMDIDIPLDGDGTGEYEPLRRKNSGALAPEEEIGEYNRLSDAPAVAQELASMRQTRLARTVLTGVLTLFLLYLGLSARTGWLPPIGVLDPHTAPLTYLVTNFVLLAVAAFSSITTLGAGLRGLALQPTSDSFTALAVVGAALQNAALLFDAKNFDPEAVTLFAPVAALLLCGNALGKWLQIRAVCANFALASSGEEHAAAFLLEKEQLAKRLCDGLGEPEPRLLLNRPTALVKGFLRQSFSPRAADAMVQKLCWGLGGAALVCAVVAGVKGGGVISALSGLAAALSLSAPLAATLVYALPTSLMQWKHWGAPTRCC